MPCDNDVIFLFGSLRAHHYYCYYHLHLFLRTKFWLRFVWSFLLEPLSYNTASSVARRNSRGASAARKNAIRASVVENWSTALCGPSAAGARWLFSPTFFFFFYTILTSTQRGASAVENLGSPRYWDRQFVYEFNDLYTLPVLIKFTLSVKKVGLHIVALIFSWNHSRIEH